jgi:2-polyprenyl-6-methoxyphenol hydroxylase-like FAD-dependent oxidoreductase
MLQEGFRHWKFETFANNGHGSHAANAAHQSYRVWENEVTEFNWSLSYECDKVCEALIKALASHGVQVDYQHELINLDDGNPVYYQQQEQTVVATLQNHKDDTISHWRSRILIGADGKRSFVRHKLGIAQHSQGKAGVFYTLVATVSTNFTGTRMSVVTKGQNAVFIVGKILHSTEKGKS